LITRRTVFVSRKREETSLCIACNCQFDDKDASRLCGTPRRRVDVSFRDQRSRLQISEICLRFFGPEGWVQWGANRGRRDGENGYCQLRTIRQHYDDAEIGRASCRERV